MNNVKHGGGGTNFYGALLLGKLVFFLRCLKVRWKHWMTQDASKYKYKKRYKKSHLLYAVVLYILSIRFCRKHQIYIFTYKYGREQHSIKLRNVQMLNACFDVEKKTHKHTHTKKNLRHKLVPVRLIDCLKTSLCNYVNVSPPLPTENVAFAPKKWQQYH